MPCRDAMLGVSTLKGFNVILTLGSSFESGFVGYSQRLWLMH